MNKTSILWLPCLILTHPYSLAGEADVIEVAVRRNADDSFDFTATVRHADTGWDHYADRWEIADRDGNVLATRVLHHPHVEEQPFTRSLSGVAIAADISAVTIRAHDSVHGLGGTVKTVELR